MAIEDKMLGTIIEYHKALEKMLAGENNKQVVKDLDVKVNKVFLEYKGTLLKEHSDYADVQLRKLYPGTVADTVFVVAFQERVLHRVTFPAVVPVLGVTYEDSISR